MPRINRPRLLLHPIGLCGAVFLSAFPGGPTCADEKTAAQDLKNLQGTWVVIEAERDGAPLDRIKGNKLVVKDNHFTVVTRSAELKGDLTLGPNKSPKTVDFHHQEGQLRDKKGEGIYRLDGDRLTLCYAEADSGKERPDAFATREGSSRLLIVVQRQKP